MIESIDYWLTRRGIKRGAAPNKASYLYRGYVRWIKKEFAGEVEPASHSAFVEELVSRGFKQETKRTPRGRVVCWMLNKYVVPLGALNWVPKA
jgi:hypothetical protein